MLALSNQACEMPFRQPCRHYTQFVPCLLVFGAGQPLSSPNILTIPCFGSTIEIWSPARESDNDTWQPELLPLPSVPHAAPVRSPPCFPPRRGALRRRRPPLRLFRRRLPRPVLSVPPRPSETRLLLPPAATRTSIFSRPRSGP